MVSVSPKTWLFIALTIVVTALTWTLGLIDIQYKVESNVAFADGFPGDTSLWKPAGDWSNVDIADDRISIHRDTDNRSFAKRSFSLPTETERSAGKLRITGTLETLETNNEDSGNPGAAYMVWLQNDDGDVVRYLTIQDLDGSQAEYEAERIVSIPEGVSTFTLVLNSRDSPNSFSLTAASAELISDTPAYRVGSILLVLCWLVILVWCAIWLYQKASAAVFIAVSVLIATIIAGVMLPETLTLEFVNPIFSTIASQIPAFDLEAAQSTYKLGHFIFFFLISLVLAFSADSLDINRYILLFLLLLLAIASEGMQLHLFNRTTRLSDLGIDGAGIMLGWFLGGSLAFIRSRRRTA